MGGVGLLEDLRIPRKRRERIPEIIKDEISIRGLLGLCRVNILECDSELESLKSMSRYFVPTVRDEIERGSILYTFAYHKLVLISIINNSQIYTVPDKVHEVYIVK